MQAFHQKVCKWGSHLRGRFKQVASPFDNGTGIPSSGSEFHSVTVFLYSQADWSEDESDIEIDLGAQNGSEEEDDASRPGKAPFVDEQGASQEQEKGDEDRDLAAATVNHEEGSPMSAQADDAEMHSDECDTEQGQEIETVNHSEGKQHSALAILSLIFAAGPSAPSSSPPLPFMSGQYCPFSQQRHSQSKDYRLPACTHSPFPGLGLSIKTMCPAFFQDLCIQCTVLNQSAGCNGPCGQMNSCQPPTSASVSHVQPGAAWHASVERKVAMLTLEVCRWRRCESVERAFQ